MMAIRRAAATLGRRPGGYRLLSAARLAGSRHLSHSTIRRGEVAPSRLLVMGDIHGDLDAFETSLKVAGLVADKEGDWTGGDALLVQIGDVLDRGRGEVPILLRLQALKQQAAAAGGGVICLVGNHEVMNYEGDFRYVSDPQRWGDGFKPFEMHLGQALDDHCAALGLPSWRARADLQRYPSPQRARAAAFDVKVPPLGPPGLMDPFRSTTQILAVVGDTLLVHGGLLEQHLAFAKLTALHAPDDHAAAAAAASSSSSSSSSSSISGGGSSGSTDGESEDSEDGDLRDVLGAAGDEESSATWLRHMRQAAKALVASGGSSSSSSNTATCAKKENAGEVVLGRRDVSSDHGLGSNEPPLEPRRQRILQHELEALAALCAVNEEARSWVNQRASTTIPSSPSSSPAPVLLTHENGPVWLRAFSDPPDLPIRGAGGSGEGVAGLLVGLMRRTGCRRLVMGHTPQDRVNFHAVVTRRWQQRQHQHSQLHQERESEREQGSLAPLLGLLQPPAADAGAGANGNRADVADADSGRDFEVVDDESGDSGGRGVATGGDGGGGAEDGEEGAFTVWRVDTGASTGIRGGRVEVLEILTGEAADDPAGREEGVTAGESESESESETGGGAAGAAGGRLSKKRPDSHDLRVSILVEEPRARVARFLRNKLQDLPGNQDAYVKKHQDEAAASDPGPSADGLWRVPAAERRAGHYVPDMF